MSNEGYYTMIIINEDTDNKVRASNPLGAAIDAQRRGLEALEKDNDFFASESHMDRLDAVATIVKGFFGRFPDFYTPRSNKNKPFENVKVSDVGRFLNKKTREEKSERLYAPLVALGNVDVKSTNGHILIRVYKA
jgi:hypothetical protein